VAIQKNRKLVVAGSSFDGATSHFALARYQRNGALDKAFGHGGIVTTDFPVSGAALAVVVQRNGKIVVGGQGNRGFALARYTANGFLDPTFGGGVVTTPAPPGFLSSVIYALALQRDGKIVAAGTAVAHEFTEMVVRRYRSDGSIDTSFGSNGTTILFAQSLTYDFADAVHILASGKILIGGSAGQFALIRLTRNGTRDKSFGENGDGTTLTPAGAMADAMAVQANGRIVLAGSGGLNRADFVLARYERDGVLDTSFGNHGIVRTRFSSGRDAAHAVAVQRDGKLLAAGGANEYYGGFALVRYFAARSR
jgi:uncharacterized delta-60 repeat protein